MSFKPFLTLPLLHKTNLSTQVSTKKMPSTPSLLIWRLPSNERAQNYIRQWSKINDITSTTPPSKSYSLGKNYTTLVSQWQHILWSRPQISPEHGAQCWPPNPPPTKQTENYEKKPHKGTKENALERSTNPRNKK